MHNVKCFSHFRGIVYSLLSGIFYSISSVIIKYVENISSEEFIFFRFSAITAFSLPFAVYSRSKLLGHKSSRLMLFLQGLAGTMGIFLSYITIKHLPVGDASAICFSYPVFVIIAARVVLKEPFGYLQLFAAFLTILGIAFISKMPLMFSGGEVDFNKKAYAIGISAAVGSIISITASLIFYRMCTNVHNFVILFTTGWIGTIFSIILATATNAFKYPNCGLDSWLVPCIGICSFLAFLFMLLGLKEENTGVVATVRAGSDIIGVYIWQICFFKEIPDAYSISGALLVSSCVLFISGQKWIESLTGNSTAKNFKKQILERLGK